MIHPYLVLTFLPGFVSALTSLSNHQFGITVSSKGFLLNYSEKYVENYILNCSSDGMFLLQSD